MTYLYQNLPLLEKAVNDPSDCFRSGNTTNLLEKWDQISPRKEVLLEQITNTISWFQTYLGNGSEAHIKVLEWT
eukprot:2983483-Ditylum_brightwellii.AAC.5